MTVVLVSRPGDGHGDAVEAELARRGVKSFRLSLSRLETSRFTWRPEDAAMTFDDFTVTGVATVWWRRPGWYAAKGLDDEEAELARAEGIATLFGVLAAQQPRWVDHPVTIAAAEAKPVQLKTAMDLGIVVPDSVITNRTAVAERLAPSVVAKAISSGSGLAPFVEEASRDLLPLVRNAPVLLQRRLVAQADLRIVTVASEAFVWRRPRGREEPVDWREADAAGLGFELVDGFNEVRGQALMLAVRLGLTMTSQDWLETEQGLAFLEVNPQGQWLFLPGARSVLVSAVATHLAG